MRVWPIRVLLALAGAIAGVSAGTAPAQGQSSGSALDEVLRQSKADSVVVAPPDSLGQANSDSLAAARADSIRIANLPPWWTPLRPTVDGLVRTDVARIVGEVGVEAPVGGLIGGRGKARYSRRETEYRQFERNQESTAFVANLVDSLFSVGQLTVDMRRDTSHDENRVRRPDVLNPGETTTQALVVEYDIREVHAKVNGFRSLGEGTSASWAVRGDIEDAVQTDKGVGNDRSLAGAAITSAWRNQGDRHDLTARYGFERLSGQRDLRGQTADATAERDTLWTKGALDFGPRFDLDVNLRRTSFVEDRLDFARNVNGVVDTLNTLSPVAPEHESTWRNSWDLSVRSRLLPRVAWTMDSGQQYSESDHTFSREGLVIVGNNDFSTEATLRYASAGSLSVRYSYTDRYNNRRSRGSEQFRGRESRRSQRAELRTRQSLAPFADLQLNLGQTLDQSINDDPANQNDRDRLVSKVDLKLLSRPWSWFRVEAAGTYSKEQEINIDAIRVGNNRDTDLFEVRGIFIADPDGGWRFTQSYRLQIRLIDQLANIKDDQFNKSGQWDNRIEYAFSNGVFTDAQYIVDYRRNGDRDPNFPDQEIYVARGTRRDHRIVVGARVPLYGLDLKVRTERGFLRDNSGFREVSENRGKLTAGVRGNWSFWNRKATLSLDAGRTLQFGPRVRDEQRDYWITNTTLKVVF